MMNYNPALANKPDADNIYVNVRINHLGASVTSRADYDVTKDIPIIKNPDEYYIAIVDFTIPLTSIPLSVVKIVPGQPNANLMEAAFYIRCPGGDNIEYAQNAIFVPTNNLLPPVQSNPNRQIITPYYYIYSYTPLLAMFNTAITAAYDACRALNPAIGGDGEEPYFYLNPETQLISLIISDAFQANGQLLINDASLNYLQGFNLNYIIGPPPGLANDRYLFNFYTQGNICNPFGGARREIPGVAWFYDQEYQSLDLWSDLRKIYITSSTLPIKGEEKPINLLNGTQTGQVAYIPVLFDYTPVFDNSSSARTISYYVPQSQYRLVDILGTEPISKISLEIFWQDTLGDSFPLFLQIYQAINVKVGFFRKSVYKNYYPEEHPRERQGERRRLIV